MREGWQTVKLGDVCMIRPPKKEAKEKLSSSDLVSFVPMEDLNVLSKGLTLKEPKPLNKVSGSYTYFADGDVLLAKITPCFENGKIGIASELVNGIGFGSSEFIVFRSKGDILPDYLFHYLSQASFRKEGKRVMSGAVGHKRVPKEFIEEYRLPLPSLPEQKRIVGILDTAFEAIDKAIANAEKNLQNAKELFQSVLRETFSQKGEDWIETTLGEVCGFQNGFAFKSSKFRSEGSPILRISNLQDGSIDTAKLVFTEPDDYKEDLKRYEVEPGSLLIAMSGATTGKIGFNTTETTFLLNQRVGRFIPSKRLSIDFLFLFLSTRVEDNLKISAGAAQPNLSTSQIKDLIIPLPPITEQERIVRKLDMLSQKTKQIEVVYERKKAALAELKQSLLQQAFSGKL